MHLLQALYDVYYVISFNAFQVVEVAVASCVVQSAGVRLLAEIATHRFCHLVCPINQVCKRGCVGVLLVNDVVDCGCDGGIDGNVDKPFGNWCGV